MSSSSPSSITEEIEPFEKDEDFLMALQNAIEDQSGITLNGEELREAGRNINNFLSSFLIR